MIRNMSRTTVSRRISAGLIFLLAVAVSTAQTVPDRSHIDEVLRGLSRGRSVGQVAVSPDGARLAWIDFGRDGGIRIAPIGDLSKAETVKVGDRCSEDDILWRPDSKALAFFATCGEAGKAGAGQADLYLSHLDGQTAARLTQLNGYSNEPAFSPDGTKVAFLYVEGATRPAGALAAMKPPAGVIGEDGIEIQRIAIADATVTAPAAPTEATPANLHAFEFGWSPDSKALVYIAAEPPGENNWWTAKLYTQALGSSSPTAILAPAEVSGSLHGLQIAVPRWSPDGKQIAFIGGLMSDQGSTGGDVWLVPATGGQPRNLTPKRASTPAWIDWDDNQHLFISEIAGGNDQLVRLQVPPKGSVDDEREIYNLEGSAGDGRISHSVSSTADHSLFIFRLSSLNHPMEIYAVDLRSGDKLGRTITQLSHFNDSVEPAWGKSESLSWKSDGFNVQGWLLLPKNYDAGKKYPLIVLVHGGPAAAVESRWGAGGSFSAAAFSALGYFVLQANPRGSFGQGEAFVEANRKDFGYGDLRDILAGVDAAEAKYSIDDKRVGLTGWSYGGFMTMFAVTQTHRFRAAVAGAGISDWQSYYGENSIGQWMIPYFGASVYDDPKVYAKSSAIDFIKQAKTPTLVVVGDRDGECPAPQSYEFWHALRDEHVPTQFVVYPNEGHGFVDPAHRRDVAERAIEWFARYMPASE
jgi:dipeptidyl aminopeptidase/acylaminoacyl peptidase